jgi:choline dehydrogenase-like flavoprotein
VTLPFGVRVAARLAARAWLPPRKVYDVVVVGSGATGGWAAKELTEAGLDVLVLEAGRGLLEETAMRALHRVRSKAGYRAERDARALERQATQAQCYAWAGHPHAFVDDVDNPYSTAEGKPFAWFRARQLGGRLAVRNHGLYFMRHSDFDFRAASRDGHGADWPMAYTELVPHYERVERAVGIRGNDDGVAHLPASIYAGPAEPFTSLHLDTKAAIERRWPGRHVIGRRTTNPPPALAHALHTGRLTLRANAVVSHVVIDKATGRAAGVAFVDRRTGRAQEVRGKVVVLCASAVESTRILLNSETPDGGRGLGNSSGVLGRYLVDHVYLSGLEGRRRGRPPRKPSDAWSHLYLPQLANVSPASQERGFSRGYGIQLALSGDAVHAYFFGEMLPRAENHVTLDHAAKDRWGIPVARIDCAHGDNERKMVEHMLEHGREMMRALDAEIEKPAELRPVGASIHEVGTARMGRDPKASVVDPFCRSWDVKNLFVADGASFPSQGVQNPTLTMLALTARCADFIVEALRRGEL